VRGMSTFNAYIHIFLAMVAIRMQLGP